MTEPTAAGYAAAMHELDALLADLEDDALDIDLLGAKVARASELIRFCRERITAARLQVDRIVAELDDQPGPAGTSADAGDPDESDVEDVEDDEPVP